MTPRHERRRLVDWVPDDGPVDAWAPGMGTRRLEAWYDGDGTDVVINGRLVRRFAMIQDLPDRDGTAPRGT